MKTFFVNAFWGALVALPLSVIGVHAYALEAGDPADAKASVVTNVENNNASNMAASLARAAAAPFIYSGTVPIQMSFAAPNGISPTDQKLRIVQKIHRQMDAGLLVVGALMGSFRLPVSKEHYKGTTVDGILHPANEFFVPAVSKLVDEWIQENAAAAAPYKNAILIRPDTMVLVYANFDEENPKYDFYLQTTVSRSPDSRSFFALDAPPQVTCSNKYSEPALDLMHWQADDYAELRKRIQNHVDDCLPKLKVGLAQLLAA